MNLTVIVAVVLQVWSAGLFIAGMAVLLGEGGFLIACAVVMFALGWALEARFSI